jgi:hypothetical protein
MNACPVTFTLAVRSRFNPRIGRSRAFSRPWSVSMDCWRGPPCVRTENVERQHLVEYHTEPAICDLPAFCARLGG